jgi:hypothetical protein
MKKASIVCQRSKEVTPLKKKKKKKDTPLDPLVVEFF